MMNNALPNSDHSSVFDGLDLQLLHSAQAYLKCLRGHQTPSSESAEAGVRFYQICDSVLRRFAISCHVRPNDQDDCVQAAWKEIILSLPAFQDRGDLRQFFSWLHLIVRNKAADGQRNQARHTAHSLTALVETGLTSRDPDPADEQEARELRARVQRVLANMRGHVSVISYRVFELRLIEGRSVAEVATEVHLPAEQIRSRCCRMKQKFRRMYEADARKD
jgi:RNA polymerase sigma factor (sigma-70 family)